VFLLLVFIYSLLFVEILHFDVTAYQESKSYLTPRVSIHKHTSGCIYLFAALVFGACVFVVVVLLVVLMINLCALTQAEETKARLQHLEKLLAHFDCRGKFGKQQQQRHMTRMYEHEHQREDALPNALEDFLAFQGTAGETLEALVVSVALSGTEDEFMRAL